MKHLAEYIFEKKTPKFANEQERIIYNKLVEILSRKETLGDYVKQLNEMLKNKDAKQILTKAFGKASSGYKFDGEFENFAVKDLHPTQAEIDVNKSIGFPFKSVKLAKINGKRYYADPVVSMPFPLITYTKGNTHYILDGHHRWSQVYSFNPNAKMACINISVADDSENKDVSANDVLKICQGVLAAKRATDKKEKQLPAAEVKKGANVFDMDDNEIREAIQKYTEIDNGKPAKELAKWAKIDSVDKFVDLLATNLKKLKKENQKYYNSAVKAGNERGYMPQIDKGGDYPEKDMGKDGPDKTALPKHGGSALNRLIKGKISDKTINK